METEWRISKTKGKLKTMKEMELSMLMVAKVGYPVIHASEFRAEAIKWAKHFDFIERNNGQFRDTVIEFNEEYIAVNGPKAGLLKKLVMHLHNLTEADLK